LSSFSSIKLFVEAKTGSDLDAPLSGSEDEDKETTFVDVSDDRWGGVGGEEGGKVSETKVFINREDGVRIQDEGFICHDTGGVSARREH